MNIKSILLIIIIGISIPLLMISNSVYGQYSKFDFILELDNVSNNPKITYFEIRNESSKDICPHKECKIDYEFEWFSTPTKDLDGSTFKINFITLNNTIGSDDQKIVAVNNQTLQKYQMSMFYCQVNTKVDNDYYKIDYCNEQINILRESDSKNWDYNSSAIYDINYDTYTVVGKYIDDSTL